MDTIGLSFVAAVAVIIVVYIWLSRTAIIPSSSVSIQNTIADGKKTIKSTSSLPTSLNQTQGLTFSYSCWVRIDDFTYKYGTPKVIFNKGAADLSTMCPALLIDGTTNSLLIKADTFGGTEVIPISNIPAKKWLHIAIAVDQDSIDVYVNGVLRTHHSISHMPKQNTSTVQIGLNGGFEGKISNLQYYSYFMTPDQVRSSMSTAPQPDPTDSTVTPLPPYFDASWWTGRN